MIEPLKLCKEIKKYIVILSWGPVKPKQDPPFLS